MEGEMSAMSLEIATATSPDKTLWQQLKYCAAEWRARARSRRELASLDASTLADIGMSRCTAAGEASKPFWMA
jgi:uncharacterized protein YjiS (DUF1127 family)